MRKEKIRLKHKSYSLADVVTSMFDYDTDYIKYCTRKQFDDMIQPDPETEQPSIYVPIKVFLNKSDKKNNNFLYMVFINNGQIHYSHHDVLEDIKLDDPLYFFDYKIEGESGMIYPTDIQFDSAQSANTNWDATFNYDYIFSTFFLDGSEELSWFCGLFLH